VNASLFLIGIGKIVFGILVGAAGVVLGSRVLGRLLRWGEVDEELGKGNLGVAVLGASGLLSLGLLAQHAVTATFGAMDLMYRGERLAPSMLGRFLIYGAIHVGVSLAVGAGAIAIGAALFVRLTRGVDELAEIRRGNAAPALMLGAVIVLIALMTAPGLQTTLDGLLPLPQLARDVVVEPA
jgi:uncharacterized membrane protein YjfL (UPF0719 family)